MSRTPYDFTEEFINAGTQLRSGDAMPSATLHNAAWLQLYNYTLELMGGGYIYLPPGEYFIGRPATPFASSHREVGGDVVIAPTVTLWFAPGAILTPVDGALARPELSNPQKVRIEIQGDIIAEVQQIFGVVMNRNDFTPTAGTIFLTSHRIREVYPEWWGAATGADPNTARQTTMAIQAMIDAAYHNRTTVRLDDNGMPVPDGRGAVIMNRRSSIPMVMRGQYTVDAELHIGVPRSLIGADGHVGADVVVPLGGFELRGETGVGDVTLQPVAQPRLRPPFPPGVGVTRRDESLIAIRGPVSFLIQDIGFSAGFIITRCMSVEPIKADWGYSSIKNCLFKDCLGVLVSLDSETRRRITSAPIWQSKQDFWNITFTKCLFHPAEDNPDNTNVITVLTDGRLPDEEGNLAAIDVRLGDNEGMELRDCWLRGAANPAIRAFSGRFALNECLFHVTTPPILNPRRRALVADRNNYRGGSDISIETPAAGDVPGRVVPATFTARECDSHSIQFLVTTDVDVRTAFPGDSRRSATVLLNVLSSIEIVPSFFQGIAGRSAPPGIYWSSPGQVGCPLVMIGCSMFGFKAEGDFMAATDDGQPGRNRHAVICASAITGDIYDVASNMFNNVSQPGRSVYPLNRAVWNPTRIRRLPGTTLGTLPGAR